MAFVTSLSLERGKLQPDMVPIWQADVNLLVTVIDSREDGNFDAYGVDAARDRLVFEAVLRPEEVAPFLKALIDRVPPVHRTDGYHLLLSTGTGGAESDVVVISNPPQKDTGPKAVAFAAATEGILRLANGVRRRRRTDTSI